MRKIGALQDLGQDLIPGNDIQLRLGFIALILNRNILIEDVPGMGKTTLVKFFAKASGLDFKRIQFTNDLLPSDILGVSIFHKETEQFSWRPGPIFGELILADELNRGTPKTQSALLQAMEEKHVSVDGVNHQLPERFCLFATQNPRGQFGTYPLPESQLDRFLFKFPMGHLSRNQEKQLLLQGQRLERLEKMPALFDRRELSEWEAEVESITVSSMLLDYLTDVLQGSRQRENVWGLSPRAGLDLLDAAKGWAFLEGRSYVLPDDVGAVFPYVAGHRMFSYHSLPSIQELQRAREFLGTFKFTT